MKKIQDFYIFQKKNQNFQFHEKIQDFQNFQKKKKRKRKRKFSKRALGLRALGSYFLGCFKKKKKITKQNFQFLEKIQDSQIKKKKKKILN